MNRDLILAKLHALKPELTQNSSVASLAVFGSVARNESKQGSDIDILVEFIDSPDIFAFLRLRDDLSRKLGGTVDLVTRRALHPALKERILSEAVYV